MMVEHPRSLIVSVIVVAKQLPVSAVVFRRLDPLPGDNTR
jgi:hypothetical protein